MVSEHPPISQPIWENIPLELRVLPRWVVWNWKQKPNGKWDKPPLQLNGYGASPINSAHWTTFESAKSACMGKKFHGVGFVFPDVAYTGIDLDDCLVAGEPNEIAQEFLSLGSYAEISPSGNGIKFWFKGGKKFWNRKLDDREIYTKTRYFTVTGNVIGSGKIRPIDGELEALVTKHFGNLDRPETPVNSSVDDWISPLTDIEKARNALKNIPPEIAEERFTWIQVGLACKATSPQLMEDWIEWSATAPTKFESREDCEKTWHSLKPRGDVGVGTLVMYAQGKTQHPRVMDFLALEKDFPQLRPILIQDIMRVGEVANLISAPKVGKSFLVGELAIATATGAKWLGKTVTRGRVLVVDYELHQETLSSRYSKMLQARGLQLDPGYLDVLTFRGEKFSDLVELSKLVDELKPNHYSLIIVDALYRIIPQGISENDNAGMLRIYNEIDRFAKVSGASWMVVHHSTKGDQSAKSTVDMGSGAGSINRAVDSVIAIKEHETPGCAVCEIKNRSFPSLDPFTIRWDYPLWHLADEIVPEVKQPKGGRKKADVSQAEDLIMAELRGAGEAVSQALVIEVSGLPRESCRRLLYEMQERGVITKEERSGRIYWKDAACDIF
jgi:hypothetical protein